MPGMDGFETAGYIRGSQKTAHTPIIFLTAHAEAMQSAKGYALGAVDCIVTPVIPEILRTKVRVFVELYLMTRAGEARRSPAHDAGDDRGAAESHFFTDTDGRYRGVNKAWETFFGLPRAAVVGKTTRDLFGETVAAESDVIDRRLIQDSGTQTYEAVIPAADGVLHNVMYYKATYAGPEGPIAGLIATIIDITERKQADKRQAMEHAVTRVLAEAANLDEADAESDRDDLQEPGLGLRRALGVGCRDGRAALRGKLEHRYAGAARVRPAPRPSPYRSRLKKDW